MTNDLQAENDLLKKLLWVIVRKDPRIQLYVPDEDLKKIPKEAELMIWYEDMFGSHIVKALNQPIGGPHVIPVYTSKKSSKPSPS